ncbi:DNA polymerase III subunit delta [Brassicibacter mesophilus]|uniref:DNA polymerase III subunit delta n=1 Tax=Brassicibacter mesophilus TaxID=745119 RepID=UPI003D223FAD
MSYKIFLNDIEKNNLKKVYILYGNEMYLKDWFLSEVKNRYVDKSFETLNYVHLDGKEISIDNIINACETLPFMSDKKIVVVEDVTYFTSTKGSNVQDEEELSNYLLNLNESTCLIFVEKEDKIDNRKKIVKKVKEVGSVIQLTKLKDEELNKWILDIFGKNGKKISKKDIYYFIQASGYFESSINKTLYDLENEIIKICNYLGDRNEVTKNDIDKVGIKTLQNNIFKLVDGIGQKKTEVSLSIFNEMLLESQPLQVILHMIIRQLRLLLMAKLLEEKGYSHGSIAQKMNIHSFVAQKIVGQSKNFTIEELKKGLEDGLEVDKSIKTGKMDSKLAVEMLIVEFSNLK